MTPAPALYINGRFAAQKLTGVQRFATEITTALQHLAGDRLTVLLPADATLDIPGSIKIGRQAGQAWEQFDLPRHAGRGTLINLGNTAPLRARRQLVVIHDAGVFSTPEAYSWKFRLWYKSLQFLLVKRGARIVTVSAASRAELVRHLPVELSDVAVISEGADHMTRMAPDPSILAAHGLQPGRYVFAVGTLAAHKNLSALGCLAERLAARGMVLALSGATGPAAFRGSGTAALPAAARYLGRVSDEALSTLYSNAACYVLPSRYEGFGLPAVEAMACGCAVVAANIPSLQETCGTAAVYCDQNAPDNIADTVQALIDTPARLAELQARARDHVRNITWARAARALYDVVQAMPA